jgi:serine/threonine protein kinase/TolA-binding protein
MAMTVLQMRRVDARSERVQALFQVAVELKDPERQTFITRETSGDPTLREELLGLLAGNKPRTGPMSRALSGGVDTTRDKRRALVGRIVGNYQLVSVLGHGGAGTVYLGERADRQYSGQVAVKIVDHTAVQANLGMRFRAERQILASLNHPNIARLVDAGETEDGQPYLVMEYVHGETLDRYCDGKHLDIRARLRLFLDICAAVHYAHQNLIVHRDLKPGNILVTAEGVPKLLDFGIAKLLDAGDVPEAAELTRFNDRLLTPEYASPEQILGGTVTTASDVYSLGIVLYQLLCGLRPYDVPASLSQLELERSICVADPPRPSIAVVNAMEAGPTEGQSSIQAVAQARDVSADRLHRELLGDIDSIVMRALRKEPQHRYSSVEQLVLDIRRYLSNEPVQARQGNWLYYSQRFVRRHTAGVAAGAGFLVFVIGVAIVMSIQRQTIAGALDRAMQDRQRAEKVSEFMLNVFTATDPFINLGKEPTARDLLDRAAGRIQSDLDQQPDVHARLLEAIGRSFRRLGQPDRAVAYLQDSLRIQRRLGAGADSRLGSILTELAIALREAGKFEESDRVFAEALDASRHSQDQRSEAHAQLLVDLGRLEMLRSNTQQARDHLTIALALMRELRGPEDPEVGAILADLSNVLVWSDDLEQAEQAARAAVDIYKSVSEFHPDRVMADYRLGEILLYRGRASEAAPLLERALAAQRRLYGSTNGTVADTLGSLAQVRLAQNNIHDAEQLIREAIAAYRNSGSTAGHKIGYLQTMLATILLKRSKFEEAESLLRESLDLFAKHLPPDHQYVASAEHYLGESLLATGKLNEAEAMFTAAMNRWKRTNAPTWRSARSASALGEVLYRQGRAQDAERYLVASYRELSADAGADPDARNRARERIVQFYTDRGERPKLDELLRQIAAARATAKKIPAPATSEKLSG